MGNAGRHHGPPARAQPPPVPAVRQTATIPAGDGITATWNLRGGHGAEIEVENVGSAECEFAGHRLRAGKTAVLSVRDGTREFALAITSPRGTQVNLAVTAWHPAPSPRRTLGTRKTITRDPKTHTIASIVEESVWVEHPAEGR